MALLGGLWDYDGNIADTKGRQFDWYKFWAKFNGLELKFLDGTKVEPDNLEGFMAQYNKVIAEKGIVAVYNSFGMPCDYDAKPSKVWDAYNMFKDSNPVKIFDGMKEAISEIWKIGRLDNDPKRNRSIRMAINTTNNWSSIHKDLVRFGIDQYFDSFCTAETLDAFVGDGGKYESINKPSKVSVALMLDILGSHGDATFHIGDTIADLRASYDVRRHLSIKGENLITIGSAWGFDGFDILKNGYEPKDSKGNSTGRINFHHIAEHPSQLPGIIKLYR